MKKLFYILTICCCLSVVSGCVGPATKHVHDLSLKFDPPPKRYLSACTSRTHVYVHYEPNVPQTGFQAVQSSTYWASVPLEQLDSYKFDKWTIYRKNHPSKIQSEDIQQIQVVDISGFDKPKDKTFINRDQYLTYIIDNHGYTPPVLLYDITAYHHFHLVGSKKLHGSYRGLWNPPQGTFRDKSILLKNAWKYPFCMLVDIILYPLDKALDHALKDWT